MKRIFLITAFIFLFGTQAAFSQENNSDASISKALSAHFKQYHEMEYFSGISLSVSTPKDGIKNYAIGRESHEADSKKITSQSLFQIGSITKSFTGALLLTLQKDNKLNMNDTVNDWLPEYNKWGDVSLSKLINMSSGLPNYSDTPQWNVEELKNPGRVWSNRELISFVYPMGKYSPPLKTNYFYTNTGYLLADLIAEKAAKKSFADLLQDKIINKANLKNTFYPVPKASKEISDRLVSGYNYNQYDNPPLVGRNMRDNNLSWGGAAGAIVATSEDIVKWVQALFIEDKILDAKQKQELTSLISVNTGKPMKDVSSDDPKGFGLGVIKAYNPEMGTYWYYQGETLGYRALYMYVPCNKVIVAGTFNSATNGENDHAGQLMQNVYKEILKTYPDLICNPD